MHQIAGIIYPDIFQMTHLIESMMSPLAKTATTPIDYYTLKNMEFALLGSSFATNERKSTVLGFDGLLTNVKELKKEHPFLDDSSLAHIALSAYEHFGPSFLKKLQGEFVIVLYDSNREELILARDPIGKKNLYWYQDNNHFLFSSSLKSLLITGIVPKTIAKDAIAAYLYLGYFPQDLTPIKNVNKLLPGCSLTLKSHGALQIEPFWSLSSHFNKPTPNPIEALHEFDEKLANAVKKKLPQTKPTAGCFISGGLGSAAIAYYVTKNATNVSSYTSYFDGESKENLIAAKSVAETLKIPQEIKKITPASFLQSLIPIISTLEEPIADPNIVATYEMAHMAKGKTRVVFSGMGSDELLGAHNRYTVDEASLSPKERLKEVFSPVVTNCLIPLCKWLYKPLAYKMIKSSKINPWQYQYLEHNTIFNKRELSELSPSLVNLFDPEVFLNRFEVLTSFSSKISSYLYIDIKTRLVDAYIFQYAKLCNAEGLEWRTPYFDLPLIEFLVSLHEPQSQNDQETGLFLQKLFEGIYPKDVVFRPKRRKNDFLHSWLENEEIRETFKLLENGYLVENGLISKEWLQLALKGKKSDFKGLFSLLVLEIWTRLFITDSFSEIPEETTLAEFLKI